MHRSRQDFHAVDHESRLAVYNVELQTPFLAIRDHASVDMSVRSICLEIFRIESGCTHPTI
ncbi:MAG: hypothetical protein GF418_12685 [Chitinivibrionales bacterium]|nr:hypothetical protein [Chitinivibrionales bacterium]